MNDPITTERFYALADYAIGPETKIEPERINGIVWCATDRLPEFFLLLQTLDKAVRITLLSSQLHGDPCSDRNTGPVHLRLALECAPRIKAWFVRNLNFDTASPSIFPLPIGVMLNSKRTVDDFPPVVLEKKNLLYANFEINTNHGEREIAQMVARKVPGVLDYSGPTHQRTFREYLTDIAESKYTLCPPGSGLDCWRFWEALYCASIPVVLRSPMTVEYAQLFPIIQLDYWEELLELESKPVPVFPVPQGLEFAWWEQKIRE